MIKKFVKKIIVLSISASIILIGCQKYDGEIVGNKTYQGEDSISEGMMTLEEVRESAGDIMKNANEGKWSNLIFDNISAGIPEIDELYILTYDNKYKAYMEGSALVDAQVKVIEYFMGDTSDGRGYIDSNRNLDGEVEYSFDIIDVIKDELDSGTYKYVQECSVWNGEELVPTEITNIGPNLCFTRKVADSEDPNEYYIEDVNVDASFNMVWADIGDAIKMRWKYASENNIELVQYNNGYIENICEEVGRYYYNTEDSRLDDEYQLLNGKMSVREGIEYVESFFENDLPFEKKDYIKEKVYCTYVYKVTDDIYAFRFRLRRQLYGVPVDIEADKDWGPGEWLEPCCVEDYGTINMIETDKFDFYNQDALCIEYSKKGGPITEVIPLDQAINTVSTQIGINSIYNVQSIELIYNFDFRKGCRPVWSLICINTEDKKTVVFTVDAVTGEINKRFTPGD